MSDQAPVTKRVASNSPFAHLAQTQAAPPVAAAAVAAAAESDDDKKKKDEEAAAKKKAEDDKKKEDEAAAAKKKAEDDKKKEDDERAANEAATIAAAIAAAPEDGDEATDRSDEANPQLQAARARERGRVRSILTSDAGKLDPVMAAHMACGTSMSRRQVIEMMTGVISSRPEAPKVVAAAADPLRERMAVIPNATLGNDNPPVATLAEQIVLAGKKRRGEKV